LGGGSRHDEPLMPEWSSHDRTLQACRLARVNGESPVFGGAKKRVGRRAEHPATPHGSERCNASPARQTKQWRLALALCSRDATATATVAARNVKGNDPLPTRVTLRYTRCASTQGERG